MTKLQMNKDSELARFLEKMGIGGNISECLTCGACNSRCTWFDGEGGPMPRQMVRMAALGLDDQLIKSGMLWDCLICNRCTETCPMGITMDVVVRKARSLAKAADLIPEDIQKGIKNRLELGDVNGLTKEEFVETVEWVSEEFVDEVDDERLKSPMTGKDVNSSTFPTPGNWASTCSTSQPWPSCFMPPKRPGPCPPSTPMSPTGDTLWARRILPRKSPSWWWNPRKNLGSKPWS